MSAPTSNNTASGKVAADVLNSHEVLTCITQQEFDNLATLAELTCGLPTATIALLDCSRRWHKARYNLGQKSSQRDITLCSRNTQGDRPLVITDTLADRTFKDIGLSKSPTYVRFFAGIPIVTSRGFSLGMLCIADTQPNSLNDQQLKGVAALGRQLSALIELKYDQLLQSKKEEQLQLEHYQLAQRNAHLERTHLIDDLSTLWNNRVLHDELQREISRSGRSGQPFTIMMISIDYLGLIDEQHGEQVCEQIIEEMGRLLKKETRDVDVRIRYSTDKFIVLMPSTDHQQAGLVFVRVRKAIHKLPHLPVKVTLSGGIAKISYGDSSPEAALELLTRCVSAASDHGGNKMILDSDLD